jgi:hypothetical protein
MDARLSVEAAEAIVEDRRRRADAARAAAAARSRPDVTVRLASPEDAAELERLAALDSSSTPTGPTLVAEAGGELIAALQLDDGRCVADPFRHTAAVVDLLELRAAQLKGHWHPRRWRRLLPTRPRPRAAER